MELREQKLSSQYYYKGKIINMRVDQALLPDGTQAIREVVEHPGGVTAAILTEGNELLFVRQFRYPNMELTLELPAGKLERGEDPFEALKREQMEETGTWSDHYIFLGEILPTPGYTDEILRLWACRVSGTGALHLDEDEFLEVERIPLETAYQMALDNQIRDAKTQIGILRTYALVQAGKL